MIDRLSGPITARVGITGGTYTAPAWDADFELTAPQIGVDARTPTRFRDAIRAWLPSIGINPEERRYQDGRAAGIGGLGALPWWAWGLAGAAAVGTLVSIRKE